MADPKEMRWKIDGIHTAETMPLGRLAEYLKELAAMLGNDKQIHLMRVETGSAEPVFKVEADAIDIIRRRAIDVRNGVAPQTALRGYQKINAMLIEDKGTATLYDNTAEIIPFPGHRKEDVVITGIRQQGTLDGRLIKVGGLHEWVPVQVQPDFDSDLITGCYAKHKLSIEMAHYLYQPVRLYGRGVWNRSKEGKWVVDKFFIDNFEPLDAMGLPDAVSVLRAIKGDWSPNPIASMKALQADDGGSF